MTDGLVGDETVSDMSALHRVRSKAGKGKLFRDLLFSHLRKMIFFDGASDPNPGPSAYGFTYVKDSNEVHFECGYIGHNTNNAAEYTALLKALLYCKINKITDVQICGDSLLVVQQVNGLWRVKSDSLKQIHSMCVQLMKENAMTLKWIPREHNLRADRLSKIPLTFFKTRPNPD